MKILHWANVGFVAHWAHATAQPCRHTQWSVPSIKTLKGYAIYITYQIWNVANAREWDSTAQLRSCAPQRKQPVGASSASTENGCVTKAISCARAWKSLNRSSNFSALAKCIPQNLVRTHRIPVAPSLENEKDYCRWTSANLSTSSRYTSARANQFMGRMNKNRVTRDCFRFLPS